MYTLDKYTGTAYKESTLLYYSWTILPVDKRILYKHTEIYI